MNATINHRVHRTAVVLADALEIDRAAARLQIPIEELEQHIGQLQRELGLTLFTCNGNKAELTNPGKVYIEQLRKSHLFSGNSNTIGRRL